MKEPAKHDAAPMWTALKVSEPKVPLPPIVPRDDSMKPPTTETLGTVPSISAPKDASDHESRIAALEQAMIPTQTDVAALKTQIASIATAVPTLVKEAVASELGEMKRDVGAIKTDTLAQTSMIKKTLDIVRKDRRDSIHYAVEELELTGQQKKVFAGKGRERRLWLKAIGGFLVVVAGLMTAAGVSQCQHAPSAAKHE